jgi:hypothetical protein
MNQWMNQWINESMNESMNQWINEWWNRWRTRMGVFCSMTSSFNEERSCTCSDVISFDNDTTHLNRERQKREQMRTVHTTHIISHNSEICMYIKYNTDNVSFLCLLLVVGFQCPFCCHNPIKKDTQTQTQTSQRDSNEKSQTTSKKKQSKLNLIERENHKEREKR